MSAQLTLIFPGQGSQYVGMGKKLLSTHGLSFFTKADKILNYPLSKFCFEGPESDLKLTQNTQPAILTHSIALYEELLPHLKENHISINRVLGHSVGEYSALVVAGSLSFEEAVLAVHYRGKYMQEAVAVGVGKMIALLKVPEDLVREVCQQASTDESQVMPANFNEPSQIVISGHATACDRAISLLKQKTELNFKAIELPVSAPFHSSLMKPAEEKLSLHFEKISFKPNQTSYVANVNAQEYVAGTSATTICQNLLTQVCGSVLWTQSIQSLPEKSMLLEVGPGKVLTGLVKKIRPDLKIFNTESFDSFATLIQSLKGENS